MNFSNCINCGQCVIYCPTGSLTEKVQFSELDQTLYDHSRKVIVQYSPTVAVSIGEEFGIKGGKDMNGIINAALRKIGFDKVFETSFAADLLLIEQAEEFIERFEKNENLPLITSDCPAWVKFAEQYYPDLLHHLSVLRSPQQIMGSLIKEWYAPEENIDPDNIYSVSIMPCTAKKSEAQKVEMTKKGLADIDTVLTTREFARLIRLNGINIEQISPEPSDKPMEKLSSAGKLFSTSGGSLEALIRTIYSKYHGKDLPNPRINKLRNARSLKQTTFRLGKNELNVAAVSGMANAVKLLEDVRNNKSEYDIIEIMACPGGCVNGGGQPITDNEVIIRNRSKITYDTDNRDMIRFAHKNPEIVKIYEEFLKKPGYKKNKNILCTNYTEREVLL